MGFRHAIGKCQANLRRGEESTNFNFSNLTVVCTINNPLSAT